MHSRTRTSILLSLCFVISDAYVFSKAQLAPALKSTVHENSRTTNRMRVDADGVVRALYNLSSQKTIGSPVQAALDFIQENGSVLRISNPTAQLHTDRVQTVPGGSHVRFTQMYMNIPVYRGDIVVSMNERNQVGMVINNMKGDITLPSTTPSLTPAVALQKAEEKRDELLEEGMKQRLLYIRVMEVRTILLTAF
jgi:Zn-dependent metalloprotease